MNVTWGPILLAAISVSCLESIFRLLSYWSGENEAGRCGNPHSAVGIFFMRLIGGVAHPVQLV